MLAGILSLLGAMLLFFNAKAIWMLALGRLCQGVAHACIWILGMCLVADTVPLDSLGSKVVCVDWSSSFWTYHCLHTRIDDSSYRL